MQKTCISSNPLDPPEDFTNSRLVSRLVWNTKWKLVIPGRALLADPIEGLDKLMCSVTDVQLYLNTPRKRIVVIG